MPDIIMAYEAKTKAIVRNADSVRPWQFVLEPLNGYLKLAENLYNQGKRFSGGWNFGPAAYENYTVGNVVDEVKRLIPSILVDMPNQTKKLHEAGVLKLDITKAVNYLGWKPKLNFEETIQFTVNGYLEELHNNKNVYSSRVKQIESFCSK
jgi:CDP-glucose 4,6-dehydratase